MTLTAQGYAQVPMPRPDGAPFPCNLGVPKPKPVWWDECGKPATTAYRKDDDPGLQLRCDLHRDVAEGYRS